MANSKELMLSNSVSSPEFIQELLPAAERTALLYHLSYLCLGGFPKLERLLRERAVETQLLFGSSEAVLLKCVGTSNNLVKSLLPTLKVAVEKNKPQLARKLLEKAKDWISDIIKVVKDIVRRYDKHNSDVAKSTSDIITVKDETDKKKQQQTGEMEALQKTVDTLEANLQKLNKEIEASEKRIEAKNAEIQAFINKISGSKEDQGKKLAEAGAAAAAAAAAAIEPGVAIFTMMVPFVESIIGYICNTVAAPAYQETIKTLQGGLSELQNAHRSLKDQEWSIQNKLMDQQLNLAKIKIESGQLPNVSHLNEVQKCLSRIQQILVQLQKFWEKVGALLDTLKDRTFAGEDHIEFLEDMKEVFLESVVAAKQAPFRALKETLQYVTGTL
ncbi:uncharacterized protein isoform X2 [Danio rerio]|uniref:Uncharacterized protein isoform X2 n=3 Tax=Danio rerio TaxID=7955 RepID=A0A8M3B0C9_DANRE|nr:uncharacterized protein LOC799914 isoform X2 [Danio rerio]|eukprot:XP_009300574.1 uncharacterized protein LOC799914 isoform X2 [Danio rerio]